MKMRKKLMLIALVPLLIASGIIGSIIFLINEIQSSSSSDVQNLLYAEKLDGQLLATTTALSNFYFSATDANAGDVTDRFKKVETLLVSLEKQNLPEQDKAQLTKIRDKFQKLKQESEKAIQQKDGAQAKKQSIRTKGISNDLYVLKKQLNQEYEMRLTALNDKVHFIRVFSISASLILLLVAGTLVYLQTNKLAKSIERLSKNAESVANGDLTIESIEVRSNDEIAILNTAFYKMIENLKEILQAVHVTGDHLAASSEELSASADETSKGAGQIASSIQQISIGAEQQMKMALESGKAVEESAVGMARIAESAAAVTELTKVTTKQAGEGQSSILQTVQQMNFIHTSVDKTDQSIKALDGKSKEISEIIRMITEIAQQTNLLALNAAIEAARAGESGKGFAVVAEEVRKLAEQTSHSADQIHTIIKEVQHETKQSVQAIDSVKIQMEDGMTVANEAAQKFEQILQSMMHVSKRITEINETSEDVSVGAHGIAISVNEMADVAKQANISTTQAAEASEEQLASMEEINASALELTKVAEELQAVIQRFKM
ncbi:methyl-accepting chemotaxis protein [Microbacteriaceae bacterium 4G12]